MAERKSNIKNQIAKLQSKIQKEKLDADYAGKYRHQDRKGHRMDGYQDIGKSGRRVSGDQVNE